MTRKPDHVRGPDAEDPVDPGALHALRRSGAAGLVLGLLLLGGTACEEEAPLEPLSGVDDAVVAETEMEDAGIREVLEVHPQEASPGDTLVLRSTVAYEGSEPARLESRLCGLDLRSEGMELAPVTACDGFSRSRLVSPGDTFHQEEQAVVEGGDGSYEVEVRHLLDPEVWSSFHLRVR